MVESHRNIFGRATTIRAPDGSGGRALVDELSLYPSAPGPSDLDILAGQQTGEPIGWRNPATHVDLDDGFVAHYPGWQVRYVFGDDRISSISLEPTSPPHGLSAVLHKWRSIQFTHPLEVLAQAVHELALVPAVLFEPSRVPIHASAVVDGSERGILIGGTGGVGKTSISLELCLRHGRSFFADDITVVDRSGVAHPNLAYPKIYGYNLAEDAVASRRVFTDRHWTDRAQWLLKRARVGRGKIRRRVRPDAFYPSVRTEVVRLSRYLILVRSPRAHLTVEPVTPEVAAQMSVEVLAAEYSSFLQHLRWRAFNQQAKRQLSVPAIHELTQRWCEVMVEALRDVECRLVFVPDDYSAQRLRQHAEELAA